MAPHSSTLAWKLPWTEEPGRLQSMGVSRREDWSGLPWPSPVIRGAIRAFPIGLTGDRNSKCHLEPSEGDQAVTLPPWIIQVSLAELIGKVPFLPFCSWNS